MVRRPIGGAQGYCDPFLMLDHFGPVTYGPGEAIGAPSHPHRGFETVTYMLKGSGMHKDSHGNSGLLKDGWVQWMTAGSGIVHSEMPSPEILEKGGTSEGFQMWVNLPAKDKMTDPKYQDTPPEAMPEMESENVFIKVIAGSATLEEKTETSPIETRFPILLLDVRLKAGASHDITFSSAMEGFVYAYRGQGKVNGETIEEGQAALLDKSTDDEGEELIRVESAKDQEFRVLVACGQPLREPIAQHGPFVMNTREEIIQAIRDYNSGDFGTIDGGDEEMKQVQRARMAQKMSGRWDQDQKEL